MVDVVVSSFDGAPAAAPVAISPPCMPIDPVELEWNVAVAVGIFTLTSAFFPGATCWSIPSESAVNVWGSDPSFSTRR